MKKIFRHFRKKLIPNLFLMLLIIQNLFPLSILFSSPAQAQIDLDPQVVSADFSEDSYELKVMVDEPLAVEYLVEYQDADGVTQAVQGKTEAVSGGTEANVYLGICSTTDCVPADFETGKLIFPNTDYQADFVYRHGNFWLVENSVATVDQVELGKVYTAPQNDQVQVTFTDLPANPGSLSIQEVYLTDEQVAATGAVSNVAYDITSDMEDGTFQYDLKLPVPEENTGEVQVKYAESVEELAEATQVTSEKTGNEVVAKELNHFTVFVVTNDELGDCPGGVYSAGVCYDSIQAAVDAATGGETIKVYPGTYHEEVCVDKSISIIGVNDSGDPAFADGIAGSAGGPIIDGSGATNCVGGIKGFWLDANNINVEIKGFTFKNQWDPDPWSGAIVGWPSGGTYGDITFDYNTVESSTIRPAFVGLSNSFNARYNLVAAPYSSVFYSYGNGSTDISYNDISVVSPTMDFKVIRSGEVPDSIISGNNITFTGSSSNNLIAVQLFGSSVSSAHLNNNTLNGNSLGGTTQGILTSDFSDTATVEANGNNISNFTSGIENQSLNILGACSNTYLGNDTDEFENPGLITCPDNVAPQISNIKMFVNGVESTFMRPGDLVRVEADITDDSSGLSSIRLLAKNASGPGYIDSGYFVNVGGDKYAREFTFPADGKYIDLHTPITTDIEGLSFYIKAFDNAGNYTNSPSTRFTYDKNVPVMSNIKMYVSDDGVNYVESSFVKNGDFVRVEVEADDLESGIKDVEFRIQNKNTGEYVAPRSYVSSPVSGNVYRFEYQVPADGKYINTHGLMSEVVNEHTFWARATDNVGNYYHGINGEFTYDNSAPAQPTGLKLVGADGLDYQCGDDSKLQYHVPVWDENIEDDFDHYEYSSFHPSGAQGLDEKILYEAKLQNSWIPPVDGTYGFSVRSVDKAGNKSAWSLSGENLAGSCQITYDSIAPDAPTGITIKNSEGTDIGCGGFVNKRYITVDWDDSSALDFDHFLYDIKDKENFKSLTVSQNSGNIRDEDGLYKYRVKAVDKVGNISDPSPWCEVTLDRVAPESTITSYNLENGDEVETSTFSGLIEGTATDDNSGVDRVLLSVGNYSFEETPVDMMYWDDSISSWVASETLFEANGADNWDYQLPDVPEGIYTITSHAVDKAGNQESTFVIKIVYDKTIPEVTPTIDPASPDADNGWYRTEPTITLSATDNYQLDKIEYRWNSDGWSTYTSSLTPPGEGQNILYYRGIDKVGNTTDVGVDVGVKEVKYDATSPIDGPLNVKVESITLDSAIGRWEKPADDSDITRYVLSWKHESGDSNGTEVGADVFEHQMADLYNGEWTLTVKAMDDAGNFKESSVKFNIGSVAVVGGTTEEGTVLGVTDETGSTGTGGGYVDGATTTNEEETGETSNEEPTDNQAGQVLGETDDQCSGVTTNLPWLLLIIQFALMGLAELLFKTADKKIRKSIFWGLALLMPVVFYLARNEVCYSSFVYNWFILPSLAVTITARLVSYFFIEEV